MGVPCDPSSIVVNVVNPIQQLTALSPISTLGNVPQKCDCIRRCTYLAWLNTRRQWPTQAKAPSPALRREPLRAFVGHTRSPLAIRNSSLTLLLDRSKRCWGTSRSLFSGLTNAQLLSTQALSRLVLNFFSSIFHSAHN